MEPILDTPENPNVEKERHGCVTAWLVLMIILNSLTAVIYLFASDMITANLPGSISTSMVILLGIIGVANVVFAALLLQWKKMAFWGFAATSVITLLINVTHGISVGQSLLGLAGVAILYGVLQIKQNNVSAWDHLE